MKIRKAALYGAAFFIIVFSLLPLLWQFLTSIKTNADITAVPTIYVPTHITGRHYGDLFSQTESTGYLLNRPFLTYLFNSIYVASVSTLLCLVLGAPAAYVLARLRLPFEKVILGSILIITLFPYILLFLGLLEVVQSLRLANSYSVLIGCYTAINLPLTIMTLRGFFKQIPHELEDAARIDGYSTLGIIWKIIAPLSAPALVTTGLLAFIFAWNEFIFALTFITKDSLKTIPVAAAQLSATSLFEIPYGTLAAATVVGTLPLVILVIFFQRKIVQGLTAGAVKG